MLLLIAVMGMGLSQTTSAPNFFPLGVWYEGGVGAFRTNLIPDDPSQAEKLYRKNFADIAAHGVNVAVVPNTTQPHHKPLLDAARRSGVKLIIELGHEGDDLGALVRGQGPIDADDVRKILTEKLAPIAEHPALLRVQILDEPWREIMTRYGAVADVLRAFRPTKPPFCCVIEADNVDQFLRETRSDVVAFDCYPIRTNTQIGDPEALNRFEAVSSKAARDADKYGVPAWAVIQTHAITNVHRFPTPEEVRCMTHLALASGCRGVFWFLYQTEWLDREKGIVMEGLVDDKYREGPRWKEVRALCKEIKRMAPVLLACRPFDAPELVNAEGAAVHCLKDDKDRVYVYAVNKDVSRSRRATIWLNVANTKGSPRLVQILNGKALKNIVGSTSAFQVELPPGAGALLRIEE